MTCIMMNLMIWRCCNRMIGMAYTAETPFFDPKKNEMSYKGRPVLIIGQADATDYVVLPISRITNSHNIDTDYDLKIEPEDYPLLNLKKTSYIRTSKQGIINRAELHKPIANFKEEYSKKFNEVIEQVSKFQEEMLKRAI